MCVQVRTHSSVHESVCDVISGLEVDENVHGIKRFMIDPLKRRPGERVFTPAVKLKPFPLKLQPFFQISVLIFVVSAEENKPVTSFLIIPFVRYLLMLKRTIITEKLPWIVFKAEHKPGRWRAWTLPMLIISDYLVHLWNRFPDTDVLRI